MEHLGRIVVSVTLVAAIVGGAAGFAISRYIFVQTEKAGHAVEEYYRGVYDTCRAVLHGESVQCLEAVGAVRSKQWYEGKSKGWVWSP